MAPPRDLSSRLRKIRTDRGLSQEAVARAAGIALSTYVRAETGANQPSIPTLIAVARALGVDVGDLLNPRRQGRN